MASTWITSLDRAGVDAAVRRWLSHDALPGREIERARSLAGGYRNDNILLVAGTGEQYVLRRYPHRSTCAVEAALAARVAGIVPTAEVIAADPDGTASGQPLLLSRYMPGDLVSEILPGSAAHEAEGLGREIGATLAAIGTVSFESPGFFTAAGLTPDGTEPTADLPAFVDRCLRTGNAGHALTPAEQQALLRRAASAAPVLGAVHGTRQLVHSDFNPKNLLATRRNGTWAITAVLDWEFSFSSSPLFDIGNMLRFRNELPAGFAEGFIAGYRAAGGYLPGNWRELSQALDLFALADFLTRPPEHPFFGKAAALIRQYLTTTGTADHRARD
jgi:aminoglycoside phosphotransferase (APT) family kinase protein